MKAFGILKRMAPGVGVLLMFAGPALANGSSHPAPSAPRPAASAKPAPKPATTPRPTPVTVVIEMATQTIQVVLSQSALAASPCPTPALAATASTMLMSRPATPSTATASVNLASDEFDPKATPSVMTAPAPGWQLYSLPSVAHADKFQTGRIEVDRLVSAGPDKSGSPLNNWRLDTHLRLPQDNGFYPTIRGRMARNGSNLGQGLIDLVPTESGTDSVQVTGGVGWTGRVRMGEPTARGTLVPRADLGLHTLELRAGFNGQIPQGKGLGDLVFHDLAALQIDCDWAANFDWLRWELASSLSGDLVSGRGDVYVPFWRYTFWGNKATVSLNGQVQYLRRWEDNTWALAELVGLAAEFNGFNAQIGVAPVASRKGGARELGAGIGYRF